MGCPKLDDTEPFVEKLAEILKANEIRDITVLHMTVPCCAELEGLVAEAVKRSGKDVPQKSYVVGIDGKLIAESESDYIDEYQMEKFILLRGESHSHGFQPSL